jgi:dynein heavy chain
VHAQAKRRLWQDFQEVHHTLAEMHTFFESDGEEVQREWVRFTARIDKKVQAVLHHAVKRSLQELNRLLNGDSKTEVLPVFRWVASYEP